MKSEKILGDIIENIEEIERRVSSLKKLSDKNKRKALVLLNEAKNNFKKIRENLVVDNEELANFFLKKTVKLKNSTTDKFIERMGEKELMKEISLINRYSKAAPYDFSGEVKELRKGYRAFIFGLIPFYLLSGLYGPAFAVTALILVIPTLLAILGLRKRGSMGLMLAFAVIPIPLIMGAFSIRYGIYALTNEAELQKIAEALGKSLSFAQAVSVLMILLGASSVVLLSYATYLFYKHRHAFL
ncbi:alpha-glucosidase [Thermococcus sp.]